MHARLKIPVIPAAFFGMVLGLAGLAGSWRAAHQAWGLPAVIGEGIAFLAIGVWAILIILYALKWVFARAALLDEAAHAIQCCFIGLIGTATMLVAGLINPYAHFVAVAIFLIGVAFTFGFAIWRTGGLWQGERDHAATTPVLYLPTVAGSFVATTVGSALGFQDWAQLAFGAGLFSWLAIESVLLHRLLTAPKLAAALRPTLGIQLAPPSVGAVAYLSAGSGAPDMIVHAMIGYGLLQALLMIRLIGWIREQPFAPSYWAFTFGATALATGPIRLVAKGDTGAIATLAPVLFAGANLLVAIVAIGTIALIFKRKLVEKVIVVPAEPVVAPKAA